MAIGKTKDVFRCIRPFVKIALSVDWENVTTDGEFDLQGGKRAASRCDGRGWWAGAGGSG